MGAIVNGRTVVYPFKSKEGDVTHYVVEAFEPRIRKTIKRNGPFAGLAQSLSVSRINGPVTDVRAIRKVRAGPLLHPQFAVAALGVPM